MHEVPVKGEPIVFFDVESLPTSPEDPIWQGLTFETEDGVALTPEEREQARRKSGLNAPVGCAWMIGFADRNEDPTILSSDGTREGERDLLERFWEGVKDFDNPWWVGHNIEGYDIPFIQVRALHHDMPHLARKMGSPRLKPWEKRVLDTLKLWPRTGFDRGSWRDGVQGVASLDTICAVLGIEQQTGLMGKDVYQAFLDGNAKGVEEHLDADVRQVREVFRKIAPLFF